MSYKNPKDQVTAARRHYQKSQDKIKTRSKAFNAVARARNRARVLEYLFQNHCIKCGERDGEVLEFDHVRGKKIGNISDLVNIPVSLGVLNTEIEKCDVLCANCHRRKTRSLWKSLSKGN